MDNKIIYKKTSDYDSSTFTSDNSKVNLDDSVISINTLNDLDSNFVCNTNNIITNSNNNKTYFCYYCRQPIKKQKK